MKKTYLLITLLGVGCWLMMPASAQARVLPTTAPLRVAEQAQSGFYVSFGSGGGCYPQRYYRPRRVYYNRCAPRRAYYYNRCAPRRAYYRTCR